jgi:hypothetical protein
MMALTEEEKAAYWAWMDTRTKELRAQHPKKSKKKCWRAAQNEWSEMRERTLGTAPPAPRRYSWRRGAAVSSMSIVQA